MSSVIMSMYTVYIIPSSSHRTNKNWLPRIRAYYNINIIVFRDIYRHSNSNVGSSSITSINNSMYLVLTIYPWPMACDGLNSENTVQKKKG